MVTSNLPWFCYTNYSMVLYNINQYTKYFFTIIKQWIIFVRVVGVHLKHVCCGLCYLQRVSVFVCFASICSVFLYLVVLRVFAACFCIWLCCEYLQRVSVFGCVVSICCVFLYLDALRVFAACFCIWLCRKVFAACFCIWLCRKSICSVFLYLIVS